jgi:transposase
MPDLTFFPLGTPVPPAPLPPGTPRFQVPVRNQVAFFQSDLDSLLEHDHQARVVVDFVAKADLSVLHAHILAFEGRAGRTPIDPRTLLALWLYATLRTVGSARQLALLCEDHIAYRWICGGVSVNYHTLADFRSESMELFERLLIDHITRLRAAGLVTLDRVAHDGMRVRANAASGSFRSKESLEELRREAEEQVRALRQELHDFPAASSARQKAARLRAARERQERIAEALKEEPDVAAKKKDKTKKARASMTDPVTRFMRMANGGTNPALNVQLSADVGSQIIVGADVSQCGSDHALLVPAVQQIQAHAGGTPKEMGTDGGFGKPEAIDELSKEPFGCKVYAPPTQYKDKDGNVREPKENEPPAVKEWRERMKTDEAKSIYKERASTIECVNALARNRGLQQFPVRGMRRVKAVVFLFVLAHNLAREQSLKAVKASASTVPAGK